LQRIFGGTNTQTVIQSCGVVFILVAAAAFLYAIVKIIGFASADRRRIEAGENFWQNLIGANFEIIALVAVALICALIAIRLFSKAGSLTSQVIRNEDRSLLSPLISGANKDAIDQYIRLASLSGFAGTFTYLGFTGLPLATVALTLILLALAFWVDDDELKKGVFDMAKLTLGAFLGSFVQRNLEQEKLIGATSTGPGTGTDSSGTATGSSSGPGTGKAGAGTGASAGTGAGSETEKAGTGTGAGSETEKAGTGTGTGTGAGSASTGTGAGSGTEKAGTGTRPKNPGDEGF
jgi:hypothetical protein